MLLDLHNFQRRQHRGYLCYYINSYGICTVFHVLRNELLRTEFLSTETFFHPASSIVWLSEELFILPEAVETIIF